MNDKKRGGFIPLIAILIIGLVAIAGGTAVTVSIIKSKERPVQPIVAGPMSEQVGMETDAVDSASTQAHIQNPEINTTQISDASPVSIAQTSAILDADTKAICDNVGPAAETLIKANSVRETVQLLCKQLNAPKQNTAEQQETWKSIADSIKQKGKLWLPVWDTSLLQTFIADPTPDGYKTLCAKGTNAQVPFITKQMLSSDRTTMTTVPKTLAEVMRCDLLNEGGSAVSVTPELLQWSFADSDTDYVRQQKIEYAKKLSGIIGNSKIIVLDSVTVSHLNLATKHISNTDSSFGYWYSPYTPDVCAQELFNTRAMLNPDCYFPPSSMLFVGGSGQ